MKPKSASKPDAPGTLLELAEPEDFELDEGVITSGLCATPEAQEQFDAREAGLPPKDADAPDSPSA